MTRKSKAVLPADLDLDAVRTAPGAAGRPAFIHEQTAPTSAAPVEGGVKASTVATTLYLRPADHKRLRMLAIERNVSMQTLLLDALNLLMERVGQSSVE